MQYVTLNNGVKMPVAGFGVYEIPKEQTKQAVLDAIDVGYRLIDTAQIYFNEAEVGQAICESDVDREELFIITKVWLSNYGYEDCLSSVYRSLKRMNLDYIDMVLLHEPYYDYYSSYRALEELYDDGIIKAIGVSNFSPCRITDLCLFGRKVIPQFNQIEVNPLNARYFDQEIMEKNSVQMGAWSPFGQGDEDIFDNPDLTEIAEKYNKSVAQVILRWLVQRSIIPVSKSTHKERMAENIDIFDFVLDEEDMLKFKEIDTGESLFFEPDDPESVELFEEDYMDDGKI